MTTRYLRLVATIVASCLAVLVAAGAQGAVAQRVTLSTALSTDGASVIARGTVSPAVAGRRVVLQRLVAEAWRDVTAGRSSPTGHYLVWMHGAAAGTHTIRVVADAAGGLSRVGSAPQRVTVPRARAYLSDLAPVAGVRFRSGTVRLADRRFPKSLYVGEGQGAATGYSAVFGATYALNGRWRTFRATLGVLNPAVAPMGVRIITDGRTRLRRVLWPGRVLPVRFDVRGVRLLHIAVVQGSFRTPDQMDDTAYATAVLQNDTTTDSPSTAGTTFLSDLAPQLIAPAGSRDDQVSYLGLRPGNLHFGSLRDVTAAVYAVPTGSTVFTARLGQFDECTDGDSMTVRISGDGSPLASFGPLAGFATADVRVPVRGVRLLSLEVTTSEFHYSTCRTVIADGRFRR